MLSARRRGRLVHASVQPDELAGWSFRWLAHPLNASARTQRMEASLQLRALSRINLRARLFILVLLASLPALAIFVYNAAASRAQDRRQAEVDLLRVAELIADAQGMRIDRTRDVLAALAQSPDLRGDDLAACSQHLADAYRLFPQYVGFGAINLAGDTVCSAHSPMTVINVADRRYFQRTLETREFSIGDYQVGRRIGQPVLAFGYPIFDLQSGELKRVLYTALELATLNRLASETPLPDGAVLFVVDRNGTVLVREPDSEDWVGDALPDPALAEAVLSDNNGVLPSGVIDGVERLYAFTPVHTTTSAQVYLAVGQEVAVVYGPANTRLARDLSAMGMIAALALLAATLWSRSFIVSPVHQLGQAARRLAAGDLAARSGLAHGPEEINGLARAFDEMAAALEARDAERRRAEETFKTEYQFRRAIEMAIPSGIAVTAADGRQTYVNPAFCRMLGWSDSELVGGQPPYRYWPPEELDVIQAAFETTRNGQAPPEGFELKFCRSDGQRFDALVNVRPLTDSAGRPRGWLASVSDITERKRAVLALQQSQAALQVLNAELEVRVAQRTAELQSAYQSLEAEVLERGRAEAAVRALLRISARLYATLDVDDLLDLLVVEACQLVEAASGYAGLRAGQGFACRSYFFHGQPRPLERAFDSPASLPGWLIENRRQHLTNTAAQDALRQPELVETFGVSALLSTPILDAGGETCGFFELHHHAAGAAFSPTDQEKLLAVSQLASLAMQNALAYQKLHRAEQQLERSHAELRRLSAHSQSAREEERTRIAREIHDELGGTLTGLKMDAARVQRAVTEADLGGLLERTSQMVRMIDGAIQMVRRIATDLRPSVLDHFGLVAAIEWQLADFEIRSGIRCRLEAPPDGVTLDIASATGLFRIFQETLTNIARHANASEVEVWLERQESWLLLEVRDNGRGIEAGQLNASSSLGLLGMRERAHMLSGQLDVLGVPGQGTIVRVGMPLAPDLPSSDLPASASQAAADQPGQ